MFPNKSFQQQLFVTTSQQTYAPGRVWRESTTAEVPFLAISRKQAARIYHNARRFERQTRSAPGRQDGKLGRNGLLVLHALLFDFLNTRTGRLDPSYAAIARAACCSVSSVYRGLSRLKAAGVLNWVRRCSVEILDGICQLVQETNAYGVLSERNWKGYKAPEDIRPQSGTWGEHPPLPAGVAAARDTGQALHTRAALEAMGNDPDGAAEGQIGAALSRLGRAIFHR